MLGWWRNKAAKKALVISCCRSSGFFLSWMYFRDMSWAVVSLGVVHQVWEWILFLPTGLSHVQLLCPMCVLCFECCFSSHLFPERQTSGSQHESQTGKSVVSSMCQHLQTHQCVCQSTTRKTGMREALFCYQSVNINRECLCRLTSSVDAMTKTSWPVDLEHMRHKNQWMSWTFVPSFFER